MIFWCCVDDWEYFEGTGQKRSIGGALCGQSGVGGTKAGGGGK